MNAPAARPVSLVERAAVTAAGLAVAIAMDRVPLPYVDDDALRRAHYSVSPIALGILPFVVGYGIVEVIALLVPRLRRARNDARTRARLDRVSVALAVAIAAMQAFSLIESLQYAEVLTVRSWTTVALLSATMAAGSSFLAAAARWVSQRGLVNGFVLYWLLFAGLDLARRDPFGRVAHEAVQRGPIVLLGSMLLAVVATLIAVYGDDATPSPRVAESAYRGGRAAPAPRIALPASSILPFVLAVSLLTVPGYLRSFGVPGAETVVVALLRSDLLHNAVFGVLLAGLTLVFGRLVSSPGDAAAVVARVGTRTVDEARAQASAALRLAWPGTFAYLLALFATSMARGGAPAGTPSTTVVVLFAATLLDMVTSIRAHLAAADLVPIASPGTTVAASALRSALATEGIDARATGLATLSLLQGLGPYAPAQLLVRATDAERASALLRHWATGEPAPMQAGALECPGERANDPQPATTVALCSVAAIALALCLPADPPAPGGPPVPWTALAGLVVAAGLGLRWKERQRRL
jgi:preprotein translocase subunit SecY